MKRPALQGTCRTDAGGEYVRTARSSWVRHPLLATNAKGPRGQPPGKEEAGEAALFQDKRKPQVYGKERGPEAKGRDRGTPEKEGQSWHEGNQTKANEKKGKRWEVSHR